MDKITIGSSTFVKKNNTPNQIINEVIGEFSDSPIRVYKSRRNYLITFSVTKIIIKINKYNKIFIKKMFDLSGKTVDYHNIMFNDISVKYGINMLIDSPLLQITVKNNIDDIPEEILINDNFVYVDNNLEMYDDKTYDLISDLVRSYNDDITQVLFYMDPDNNLAFYSLSNDCAIYMFIRPGSIYNDAELSVYRVLTPNSVINIIDEYRTIETVGIYSLLPIVKFCNFHLNYCVIGDGVHFQNLPEDMQ